MEEVVKILKWVGGVFAVYVLLVLLFETVLLGYFQPDFEGYPMILLTTADETGTTQTRKLALFETDDKPYLSARHWPRGWFKRAMHNPNVTAEIDGVSANYTAVRVEGEEFDRVDEVHPMPLPVLFVIGFPPRRDILRLDKR
jgi:hypothetical protein